MTHMTFMVLREENTVQYNYFLINGDIKCLSGHDCTRCSGVSTVTGCNVLHKREGDFWMLRFTPGMHVDCE